MKYLVIFLVLVGFAGTSFAEPDYALTPFDIILSEDDFTAKGPNHNILVLERNQSATISITIQNNDEKLHKITLTNPKYSSNLFDYFVFEPDQITVPANQQNSTKLYLKIANDTDTHSSFTPLLAQSDSFGMKGVGFVIVVDREIDELTDKSLRAGLPGPAFHRMNGDISEHDAEKMIDSGFGTPQSVPDVYRFQGMTDWGQSKQFVYSPVPVDNSTESVAFWEGSGMMINYYNNADRPNINNTKSLPVRIAQDEGQQIMVNGLMGMATEQQTRMVAYGNTTYDVPSVVEFFDDEKRSVVSLHANMPLDDLLKVASSIPNYEESHLIPDKPNDDLADLAANLPLKQIKSGVALVDVKCSDGKHPAYKYDRMRVACVSEETLEKLWTRGWATMRFHTAEDTSPHALCNNYEGKWHPEHNGCRGDISDLQCSLMGGSFVDGLKICYNDICPENKTYTLCVTNSDEPDSVIHFSEPPPVMDSIQCRPGLPPFTSDFYLDRELCKWKSIPEPIPDEAIPYVWNAYLQKMQIDFSPKERSYFNFGEEFSSEEKYWACSPVITTNGTEFYISSMFSVEPFEITDTVMSKAEPDDCYKIWKTEPLLVEPSPELGAWLKDYWEQENEN